MKTYNFNKGFNVFLDEISISQKDKQKLLEAKKILRAEIRKSFNENENSYITAEYNDILKKASIDKIKPRFMGQGSFVYGTINYPYNPPAQQMDLDYGIYIPLSYTDDLTNNFQQASKVIRSIIHNCIDDICNHKDWELEKKSKCLRVTISKDSHIDLPIYSIPDEEIDTIKETMLDGVNTIKASYIDTEDIFIEFDKINNILLATDGKWIKSDPRDYFDKIQEIKKSVYKNTFIDMSRYLKAWRDFQYPSDDSKLFSIAIMSGIYQVIKSEYYVKNENKAMELSYLVDGIKNLLANKGIQDLTNENKIIMERSDELSSLIDKLSMFSNSLEKAVFDGNVGHLVEQFGNRFPKDSSYIIPVMLSSTINTNASPIKPARDYFDK